MWLAGRYLPRTWSLDEKSDQQALRRSWPGVFRLLCC